MRLVYTEQAIVSLQECLDFFPADVPAKKINEVRDRILDRADKLLENPYLGQQEEYLDHLAQSHRRIIEGHYKIIYKVEGDMIIVTDIFDTRQDPSKMKE
jgi:plasmid stabilization system protein ParE